MNKTLLNKSVRQNHSRNRIELCSQTMSSVKVGFKKKCFSTIVL